MTQHWLQTLGGKQFDLGAPTSAMVDFDAMATVLSRIPRFTGHTDSGVYSVAQHCCQGAFAVLRDTGRRDWAAAFLLHDAHEYVIGDIATPLAGAISFYARQTSNEEYAGFVVSRAIKLLRDEVDEAIYAAAGLPWPLSYECLNVVRRYDVRMLRTERDARMATPPEPWGDAIENAEPVLGCDLSPWSEGYARGRFVEALQILCPFVSSVERPGNHWV